MSEGERAAPRPHGSAYPIIRLIASLALLTAGGSVMYATIVVLKPIAAEFGTGRGLASVPYMLFMAGFGIGGVFMGRLVDRFGILLPMLVGSLCLPAGLVAAAHAHVFWQFCLSLGVLAGFFGASPTFGPLIADVSHWFTRRRGLAVALVISGSYLAGAIWPPVLQHFVDLYGWRDTFMGVGLFTLCVMLPLTGVLYRQSPRIKLTPGAARPSEFRRPLGFAPGALQCTLCAAGIGCCVAMSMPQVHIVALASDLGYAAARGAEMLSLMLGFGIVSRLASGWISDRIGGLRTLMLGSSLQLIVLVAFLNVDGLTALYIVSAAFGLAQGGIVPSYPIIVRTFFPPGEAGWRIGTTLLFTFIGMALGGWLAGALFDLTGSYTVSFINAIAFNLLNWSIVAFLVMRSRARREAVPAAQRP